MSRKSAFTGLSPKDKKFVELFFVSDNAADAYRRSRDTSKMKETTIGRNAWTLKNKATVKAALEKLRAGSDKQLMMGIQDVMQHWVDIATADPNELSSYQRRCCRHCWGRGHQYQYIDDEEFAHVQAERIDSNARAKPKDRLPLPENLGGFGFDFTKRPHPECRKCRGEGIGAAYVHDTTKLSRQARRLYAGIKQTQHGIQILTNSQDDARTNIARALGMFTERVLDVTPKEGEAIATLPTDPIEAAKAYQLLMKDSK